MKNKSNTKAFVTVLTLLIVIFGILLAYIHFKDMGSGKGSQTETKVVQEDYSIDEKESLYERIINMTDETYPKKPDEVMSLYTDFYELMYNNYLESDRLKDFILKGRIFFGSKLKELNSEESELTFFAKEITAMNDANIRLTSVEAEPCKASVEDEGVYTSYVTRKMSNGYSSYWKYYLEESVNGLYKIRGWERAEENEPETK